MNSPEGKDADALIAEFEASNSAEKLDPPQVLELEAIKDKLASVEEDIPVPDDLSEYSEAVRRYFLDHIEDDELKVNIAISPLEGHPDRSSILTQIAMKLRNGIFEYFGEQIKKAGEDKIPDIKIIIGEPAENVRYAEVNPTLQKITVILERRSGSINIDLINSANTPLNKTNEKEEGDSYDRYALHGQGMVKKAKETVEKDGLVEVQNNLFVIKGESDSDGKAVAYEDVIEIDFDLPIVA